MGSKWIYPASFKKARLDRSQVGRNWAEAGGNETNVSRKGFPNAPIIGHTIVEGLRNILAWLNLLVVVVENNILGVRFFRWLQVVAIPSTF